MGEAKRRKQHDPSYGTPTGIILQVEYTSGPDSFEVQRSHYENKEIKQRCAEIMADPTVVHIIVLKPGTNIDDPLASDVLGDCNRVPGEGKEDLAKLAVIASSLGVTL